MLKRAHDCRKTAENAAKALLMKLDGSCGGAFAVAGCSVQPWESLSSNSHTRYLSPATVGRRGAAWARVVCARGLPCRDPVSDRQAVRAELSPGRQPALCRDESENPRGG